VRVEVPALGISVPVRATGVDEAGSMALPGSADVAGWYRFGPAPASPAGATVVAAHVDDADSVGPFARLDAARLGAAVRVRTADGTTHNYTVTDVRAQTKSDVSPDDLFDRSGDARLILVTCGGAWDAAARSYTENVVVTAIPRR
jgi:LPXTG-site transpeptidase (sortase) family protein